ncbi:MAG: phosphoglycerate kinase [Clostridia bacterium]|nr:phosphoglycerate kinase [Clostridia bacterium]
MNYSNKKSITDIPIKNKTVFLRCDLNVPLDSKLNIVDTKKIDESLKTINYLIENNSKIIICSHLGRPKNKNDSNFSLKPIANYLSKALAKEVVLLPEITGENTKKTIDNLNFGDICMLENIRFDKRETENDDNFSKELASLADVYINDAFAVCHRTHASTVGITKYLPSACGFLVEKEITILENALKSPKRPFVAILGGAKVSDKIEVINNLLSKVDTLIIGGGMSYTFTNALGYSIGNSICEKDKISTAKDIMAKAKEKGVKILLPLDNIVGLEYSADTEFKTVDSDKIPNGWTGLDIGSKTTKLFSETILKAGTIIWNGPMGVYEWKNFQKGTAKIAQAVAKSGAISIIGGGDSAAAIQNLGFKDKVTHVSTGGGATLKFLEGKSMPALDAIDEK